MIAPGLFRFITGIGTDSSGNIYVSDDDFGHGVLLSSYTPSGQLNWQVNALEFVSLGGVDPESETDAYDAYHHFKINYGNQSGNLGTYYSDTYDPFLYPDDLRTSTDASTGQIQYIQGHKFLLVANQGGVGFQIARFQSGSEIAIPCVAFDYGSFQGQFQDFAVQPDNGEFIWRDLNGDGLMQLSEFTQPSNPTHRDGADFWMDSNGDVWQVNYLSSTENSIHIRRYLFQGFDSYGAPIYDFNHLDIYNQSTDFPELTDAQRVIFQPGESSGGTLYIAGSSSGTGAFTQVARIDNWETGNRTASWVANIPWDSNSNAYVAPNSIAETGGYFFVDFNTPHYVLVYSNANGSYVGEIDPGSNVGGSSAIGNDDEWTSISAYQRSNGQYVITKEEDFQAKLLMYVWTPTGTTPQAAAPAFSPGGGTYTSAQSVTLSDSTSGATIYYTTNGTTPTTSSTVYSGPINVSSSETIKAIAAASGYTTSSVATAAYTINVSSGSAVVEINAGGSAVSGTSWIADTDYSGGAGETWTNSINTSNVTNPALAAVYQSDHFAYNVSSFTYTIPGLTSGSSYTVRLHFCENFWTAAGDRVFNVSINGTQVLTNFDVYKTAGGKGIANVQQFSATANSGGQIVIVFTTVTDNAMVSGVEIDH